MHQKNTYYSKHQREKYEQLVNYFIVTFTIAKSHFIKQVTFLKNVLMVMYVYYSYIVLQHVLRNSVLNSYNN